MEKNLIGAIVSLIVKKHIVNRKYSDKLSNIWHGIVKKRVIYRIKSDIYIKI